MRHNKQLVCDAESGDCTRACLTSILGIPNDPKILPDSGDPKWYWKMNSFLWKLGLDSCYETKAMWRSGYWIATVPSLNFPGGTHSIVMKDQCVEFDPSTKKRYKRGTNLLGKGVVLGCTYLEVVDPSKLYKLVALQHNSLTRQ